MDLSNDTFLPTQNYNTRNWFVINCKGKSLGRLATLVAGLLKGKEKTIYHPSIDVGNYIILINADLILLNNKSKHYLVFKPGQPGSSLKIRSVQNYSSKLTIEKAVKGMLSQTEKKKLITRLRIYSHEKHPHTEQEIKKFNLLN